MQRAGEKNDGCFVEQKNYSLMLIYGSFFIAPAVYSKLRFNPAKDFSPVTRLFNAPLTIAANPALPATANVPSLIAQSIFTPDFLTTSFHIAISRSMNARNSAGDNGEGSSPTSISFELTSGARSASLRTA